MRVEFGDAKLDRLEVDLEFTADLPLGVIRAYRKRMQLIRAAPDERSFYQLKSLHFEKLKAARAGDFSMRLNEKYRLTLSFVAEVPKAVHIIAIEDYH